MSAPRCVVCGGNGICPSCRGNKFTTRCVCDSGRCMRCHGKGIDPSYR